MGIWTELLINRRRRWMPYVRVFAMLIALSVQKTWTCNKATAIKKRDRGDPLGRPQGGDGSSGTAEARRDGQDPEAQAAELLEEIRRRAGERDRSESERDYLKRLLDLF